MPLNLSADADAPPVWVDPATGEVLLLADLVASEGVASGEAASPRSTSTFRHGTNSAVPNAGRSPAFAAISRPGAADSTVVYSPPTPPNSGLNRWWEKEPPRPARTPEEVEAESAARARKALERWHVQNQVDRLATSTFAGEQPESWSEVWEYVAAFRRRMYAAFPGIVISVVIEGRPGGVGSERLHVHYGFSQYVHKSVLRRLWGHGHTDIRRIGSKAQRLGKRERARRCARYLSKYVGKGFDQGGGRSRHGKRYSTTRGHTVRVVRRRFHTLAEAQAWCAQVVEGPVVEEWASSELEDWRGPPIWCQAFGDP